MRGEGDRRLCQDVQQADRQRSRHYRTSRKSIQVWRVAVGGQVRSNEVRVEIFFFHLVTGLVHVCECWCVCDGLTRESVV